MNRISLSIILSIFFFINLYGQVEENTIRIVGQGSQTFEYEKLRIPFSVKEIVPNEYRKTKYKSIESILDDFKKSLMENGLKNIEFNKKPLVIKRYASSPQEEYEIYLKDKKEAEKVILSNIDGITLEKIEYIYSDLPDNFSEKMIEAAINDATRKAKSVAKSINKKIGNIISIVDRSGAKKQNKLSTSKSKSTLHHTTNVTFELLDK